MRRRNEREERKVPEPLADLGCHRWVDHSADSGDTIGGNADAPGMFKDGCFVGREVDAINLVAGDIAMHPLNIRTQRLENVDGLSRKLAQFRLREIADSGDFALDDKFRHATPTYFCKC